MSTPPRIRICPHCYGRLPIETLPELEDFASWRFELDLAGTAGPLESTRPQRGPGVTLEVVAPGDADLEGLFELLLCALGAEGLDESGD